MRAYLGWVPSFIRDNIAAMLIGLVGGGVLGALGLEIASGDPPMPWQVRSLVIMACIASGLLLGVGVALFRERRNGRDMKVAATLGHLLAELESIIVAMRNQQEAIPGLTAKERGEAFTNSLREFTDWIDRAVKWVKGNKPEAERLFSKCADVAGDSNSIRNLALAECYRDNLDRIYSGLTGMSFTTPARPPEPTGVARLESRNPYRVDPTPILGPAAIALVVLPRLRMFRGHGEALLPEPRDRDVKNWVQAVVDVLEREVDKLEARFFIGECASASSLREQVACHLDRLKQIIQRLE